ncbi:hypothetical protein OROGR_003680 [Orobanche gracilis]
MLFVVVALILVLVLLLMFTFLLVVVVVAIPDLGEWNTYQEDWWAKRSTIFPVFATIAKEILVVLASTVSVEQTFSVEGYILDERRSRLTPQNLDTQALLND